VTSARDRRSDVARFDNEMTIRYHGGVSVFTNAARREAVSEAAEPLRGPALRATGRAGASASLDRVSFSFAGDRVAIEGASLHVAAGELVCLVGPSGSGKSTILNLIAGLLAPSAGRVLEDGAPIAGPSPTRAVVFQDAALFPWLTLQQNVEYPLALQGVPKRARAERSAELLRTVHLLRFGASYPHELSGGMRQRGAIARALATDPKVLLMDEPFAALDAQTREILQGEVERIFLATKKTIVFVTHNVREAVRLADRVVLMGTRPGRILREVRIALERPRATLGADDERVNAYAAELAAGIRSEVEKIAKEEADEAWVAPGGGVRVDPRRNLGSGI
jgi:NitT/TauT family transport system ATP-binding protein